MINKKGFTLIELLVVITIISTIVITVFVNPKNYYNRYLVKDDALVLKSVFEKAQTYVKTGFKYNNIDSTVYNGYGVFLTTQNPDKYIIFNDFNKNYYYDIGEEVEIGKLDNSKIKSISINPNNFNLVYKYNNSKTYINGSSNVNNVDIILYNKNIEETLNINNISNIIDVN